VTVKVETHAWLRPRRIRSLCAWGGVRVWILGWFTVAFYPGTIDGWVQLIREDARAAERRFWLQLLERTEPY